MENSGIFRKALFGGFDQKAVLNYIEELEQGKAKLKEELDACLAKEDACRQAEEQLAQMEVILLEKDAVIASLTKKTEDLSLQLAEKMQSIERRECELSSLQQQADGLIEKSELYENVSGKIGDTLLQAQATADRIVAQAKKDQLNICTQTTEMIERTMREMEAFRASLVDIRGKLGESMESLDLGLSSIVDSIDSAGRSFQGKKTFLDNRKKFEELTNQATEKEKPGE